MTELLTSGDTAVQFVFGPEQFVLLETTARHASGKRRPLAHRAPRYRWRDPPSPRRFCTCVLPELQDGLTLVGPKGGRTDMLLTERAGDDHVGEPLRPLVEADE